jgi:predicted phosphodiesterase
MRQGDAVAGLTNRTRYAIFEEAFWYEQGLCMQKLAVLADIHGNFAALQAVADHIDRWKPDAVVVAGDIVNRGPRSRECLCFVLARAADSGWQVIRGNHEEYVMRVARDPSPTPGLDGAVRENVGWTARQLGDQVSLLDGLPVQISLRAVDGGEARVVHASMRHNRDNILLDTPDEVVREQIAPAPPLICVGHTHRPLVRSIDATLVVNAGSVGLPFDGDARACYAQLTWRNGWQATIARVAYDRDQAEHDYAATGFMRDSGAIAELIYDEFRTARPRLFRWMERYKDAVLAGTLTPAESVREYLALIANSGG